MSIPTESRLFGRPTKKRFGQRYTLWSSLVSVALAAGLVLAVVYWSSSALN